MILNSKNIALGSKLALSFDVFFFFDHFDIMSVSLLRSDGSASSYVCDCCIVFGELLLYFLKKHEKLNSNFRARCHRKGEDRDPWGCC